MACQPFHLSPISRPFCAESHTQALLNRLPLWVILGCPLFLCERYFLSGHIAQQCSSLGLAKQLPCFPENLCCTWQLSSSDSLTVRCHPLLPSTCTERNKDKHHLQTTSQQQGSVRWEILCLGVKCICTDLYRGVCISQGLMFVRLAAPVKESWARRPTSTFCITLSHPNYPLPAHVWAPYKMFASRRRSLREFDEPQPLRHEEPPASYSEWEGVWCGEKRWVSAVRPSWGPTCRSAPVSTVPL